MELLERERERTGGRRGETIATKRNETAATMLPRGEKKSAIALNGPVPTPNRVHPSVTRVGVQWDRKRWG